MPLLLNSAGAAHPAVVDAFSAPESVPHVILGWFAGGRPAPESLAWSLAFIAYQVSQVGAGETWERTAGELLEFAAGLFLASCLKL